MSKNLVIIFSGTGILARDTQACFEGSTSNIEKYFKDDVLRIYFNGCHDKKISGAPYLKGFLAPDLDFSAGKIRQAFSISEGKVKLNLQNLQDSFGQSIIIESSTHTIETIENVILYGFSRGAVSTFATARALDNLNLPISILAHDPVPGESRTKTDDKDSQYARNFDLSTCQNIARAEVMLGTYSKHNKSWENKWFRQMAPKFNPSTKSYIFLIPKQNHYEFNPRAFNYCYEFFSSLGLMLMVKHWDTKFDKIFSVPKVEQQKFHYGVLGRTQYLTSFKMDVLEALQSKYDQKSSCPFNQFDKFKLIQSLHALYHASMKKVTFNALLTYVLADTEQAMGAREFIVELNNIIQFSKKQESLTSVQEQILNDSEKNLYQLILDYLQLHEPRLQEKELFEQQFKLQIKIITKHIPKKVSQKLTQLIDLFLEENTLTQQHLIQFIDERELCSSDMLVTEQRILDGMVTNAQELAIKLYLSSKNQRHVVFQKEKKFLVQWLKTSSDLALIAPFLSVKEFQETLKFGQIKTNKIFDANQIIPKVANRITSIDDFIEVLQNLPSKQHRTIFFEATKENLGKQFISSVQKKTLSEYLDETQYQDLIHIDEQEIPMWAKRPGPKS